MPNPSVRVQSPGLMLAQGKTVYALREPLGADSVKGRENLFSKSGCHPAVSVNTVRCDWTEQNSCYISNQSLVQISMFMSCTSS